MDKPEIVYCRACDWAKPWHPDWPHAARFAAMRWHRRMAKHHAFVWVGRASAGNLTLTTYGG